MKSAPNFIFNHKFRKYYYKNIHSLQAEIALKIENSYQLNLRVTRYDHLFEYTLLTTGVGLIFLAFYRIMYWLFTEARWLLHGFLLFSIGIACIFYVGCRKARREGVLNFVLPQTFAEALQEKSMLEVIMDPSLMKLFLRGAQFIGMIPLFHALRRNELVALIDQMPPSARRLVFGKGGVLRLLPEGVRKCLLPQEKLKQEEAEKSSAAVRSPRIRAAAVAVTSFRTSELERHLKKRCEFSI